MVTKRTSVRRQPASKITASVQNKAVSTPNPILASMAPEKKAFARQLQQNMKRKASITAATNTTNIAARPDFMELIPMFVQKLLLLDVYGSIAMKSRQTLIPYFKVIAENTKGETKAGDVLSSPFVNRQGVDPNFASKSIKNELVAEGTAIANIMSIAYTPVLPGSLTLKYTASGVTTSFVDDGNGNICAIGSTSAVGYIDYSNGVINLTAGIVAAANGNIVKATYQYDNENVGPHAPGNGQFGYENGAKMGKIYLELDEINLVAEARELACYWSIYSAFAAQNEWGANLGDMAKEAAISEITAELNTTGFHKLLAAAQYRPQFNFDASPVLSGAVVPSDYLNMFKLKLNQAAASIYQETRLARPNRLVVGSNVASYMSMINSFVASGEAETVGPYKLGSMDQFEIFVDPSFDPDVWVMAAKSNDIRRNSALFGEFMPITSTDAIGLANASVQQGYCSMQAFSIPNPSTLVSGKILGAF